MLPGLSPLEWFRGRNWHPALPGCQDIKGPNPSVFLNKCGANIGRNWKKFKMGLHSFSEKDSQKGGCQTE